MCKKVGNLIKKINPFTLGEANNFKIFLHQHTVKRGFKKPTNQSEEKPFLLHKKELEFGEKRKT